MWFVQTALDMLLLLFPGQVVFNKWGLEWMRTYMNIWSVLDKRKTLNVEAIDHFCAEYSMQIFACQFWTVCWYLLNSTTMFHHSNFESPVRGNAYSKGMNTFVIKSVGGV